MNARKAVLADNPELILRVLQLRFDQSLSYPRILRRLVSAKPPFFWPGDFTRYSLTGPFPVNIPAGNWPGLFSRGDNPSNPP